MIRIIYFGFLLISLSIFLLFCTYRGEGSANQENKLDSVFSMFEQREKIMKRSLYIAEAIGIRQDLIKEYIQLKDDSINLVISTLLDQKQQDLEKQNANMAIDFVGETPNYTSNDTGLLRILWIQDSIDKIYSGNIKKLKDLKKKINLDAEKLKKEDKLLNVLIKELDRQSILKNRLDSVIQNELSLRY